MILQLNVVNSKTMTEEQIQNMITLFAPMNGKMKVHAQFTLMKNLVMAQCEMNIANENLAKKTAQFEQGRVEARGVENVLSDLSEQLLGTFGHSLGHVLSESVSQ